MRDKYFVDTNILVYANDSSDKDKQRQAKRIILDGIREESIAVSAQALSEFYVTVTRKIKVTLSPEVAKKEIQLLRKIEIVEIDFDLIIHAIDLSNRHQLSYWDSLIIAAAIRSKSTVLFSEDLNHNQVVETVKIINPFITSTTPA